MSLLKEKERSRKQIQPLSKLKIRKLQDRVDQTALLNDVLDELGEGLRLIGLACGLVGDNARIEVDGNGVAVLDFLCRLVALEDRETDVDRVAVEDAREGGGDDAGNAARLDRDGRVLTRGAAAEVFLGDHDVALLHLVDELRVDILHAVCRKLLMGGGVEVSRGDDNVGVDVVAEFMYSAFCVHNHILLKPLQGR